MKPLENIQRKSVRAAAEFEEAASAAGPGRKASRPVLEPGWVWFVGASVAMGSLGLDALRTADAVIYDAAVDRDIVAMSQRYSEAGGRGAIDRCIKLARDDWRVVRLILRAPRPDGDAHPEALALAAACIPFRTVTTNDEAALPANDQATSPSPPTDAKGAAHDVVRKRPLDFSMAGFAG